MICIDAGGFCLAILFAMPATMGLFLFASWLCKLHNSALSLLSATNTPAICRC